MPRFSSLRLRLRGASVTEYLIIIGAIAVVAVTAFTQFGDTSRRHVANLSQEIAGTASNGLPSTGSGGSGTGNYNPGTGSGGSGSSSGSGSGGSSAPSGRIVVTL